MALPFRIINFRNNSSVTHQLLHIPIYIYIRNLQLAAATTSPKMYNKSTRQLSVLCLAVLLLSVSSEGRSAEPSSHPSNTLESELPQQARSAGGVFGELRSVYQIYKDCSGAEVSSCLKLKLISTMERVSRSAQLNIVEGVTLVKDEQVSASQAEEPIRSPQEIEASLPRSLEDKEDALNSMILDKAVGFLQSHTLKIKLPNVEELQRSLTEEGNVPKLPLYF